MGEVFDRRTSDAWFFEEQMERLWCLEHGDLMALHILGCNDPTDIKKIDSIQVDARIVNDVKVSKDGKLCIISREASSKRKMELY